MHILCDSFGRRIYKQKAVRENGGILNQVATWLFFEIKNKKIIIDLKTNRNTHRFIYFENFVWF